MVSLGTFITLGAIAAIAAGGYAVYRNADKIGGALSRGVEQTLTKPLGDWADNLWSSIANPFGIGEGAQASIKTEGPATFTPGIQPSPGLLPQAEILACECGTSIVQDKFGTVTQKCLPCTTTQYNPTPEPTPIPPPPQPKDPIAKIFQSGYYYINYAGSQYDTQYYQTGEQAAKTASLAERGIAGIGGRVIENIKYLGQSKLGPAGFELFGRSQNYL